ASYFREVRKKYAQFEGALKGIDSRILVAQVPGGMLTNLENQLREQKATDRLDEVLEEIPKVRKDLGYIPLVTPTSQIVGTQAVLNVLSGERYKNIARETEGVLKGEYGATPAPVNAELQHRVLGGSGPVTCRPADLLTPEFDKLKAELSKLAVEKQFAITNEFDDTLTYSLFPQPALKFFQNRDNPSAFEPIPSVEIDVGAKPVKQHKSSGSKANEQPGYYVVEVDGRSYQVKVTSGGDVSAFKEIAGNPVSTSKPKAELKATTEQFEVKAPLSGLVQNVLVSEGSEVADGDIILVLEAMKMETEIRSNKAGVIISVHVAEGDNITAGDILITLE
ncbi:MAG: biotin/lipoyl-containing protein, partial [Pseudohongiella sp.]|nr:biotin/lipoyl-containing protein [Pseudohongiella sp.]